MHLFFLFYKLIQLDLSCIKYFHIVIDFFRLIIEQI